MTQMVETSKPGYSGIDEKLISLTTSNQEITMTFINQPQGTIPYPRSSIWTAI